jgi:hypothetical protein
MKKLEDNRYPHSAELFKFCKEALTLRHNNEVKVIDGHVGALLEFDPADCSHWKRGKKNIKSSDSLRTLSETLQVDMALLNDLVSGRTNVENALEEYRGLGEFDLSAAKLDELRSDFLRTSQNYSTLDQSSPKAQDVMFSLEKEATMALAKEVLDSADVQTCPVMIPEVMATLNESENGRISLTSTDNTSSGNTPGVTPQLRFKQAKEIGKQLLFRNLGSEHENAFPEAIVEARCNLFALNLLVPQELFQRALKQVDLSKDFVAALSDIFWVSRAVIQARLQDTI